MLVAGVRRGPTAVLHARGWLHWPHPLRARHGRARRALHQEVRRRSTPTRTGYSGGRTPRGGGGVGGAEEDANKGEDWKDDGGPPISVYSKTAVRELENYKTRKDNERKALYSWKFDEFALDTQSAQHKTGGTQTRPAEQH